MSCTPSTTTTTTKARKYWRRRRRLDGSVVIVLALDGFQVFSSLIPQHCNIVYPGFLLIQSTVCSNTGSSVATEKLPR